VSSARRALVGTCVGALLLASSTATDAYWTEPNRERITEDTAYLLPQGEFSIGILRAEFGIFDQLMVGTYTSPWLVSLAIQQWIANVYAKAGFRVGEFAVSGEVTFFLMRIKDLTIPGIVDHGNMNADTLPLSLAGSYAPLDWFTASLTGTYVQVFAGSNTTVRSTQFGTVGANNNLTLTGRFEFRLTRVTQLMLTAQYLPWSSPAVVESKASPTPTSTLNINATVDTSALQNAWAIVPGIAFSWSAINFRVGAGYGNFFIPGVGLVTTDQGFVPELDFYVRF